MRRHIPERVLRLVRLLTILLALACQVSAAATAEDATPSPAAVLQAAMVLCVAGHHPVKDGLPPHHHHLADQAAPSGGHHELKLLAVGGGARLPPPAQASRPAWTRLPQARAPPARPAAAFYPTGPPIRLI